MPEKAEAKKQLNSLHDTEIKGNAQIIVGNHGKMINVFSPGLILVAITIVVAVAVVLMLAPWHSDDPDMNSPKAALRPVSPVEHGGRFYLSDDAGYLSALDLRTGKELWSFHQTGTSDISYLQQGAGRIYAGTAGRNSKGLYALDAANGDPIWSLPNNSCAGIPLGIEESTLIVDADGLACGLNKDTGEEEWRAEGADIAFDFQNVYLHSAGQTVALNSVTGSTIWRTTGDNGTLTVAEGHLYVQTDQGIQAIDPETGKRRWTLRTTGLKLVEASTSTSTIFLLDKTGIHAVNADTGKISWRHASREAKDLEYGNETVYILTSTELLALNESTGAERWTREEDNGAALAVHRGQFANVLYILGGKVSAIHSKSGNLAWTSTVWSTDLAPALADGAAAVPQDHNDVTALDPWNGATRWTHTSRGQVLSVSYSGPPTVFDILEDMP
ncbi:PQQ-binding-like beta-propeller repeat protein [Streptomyces sp. NPDC013953]|uniref:outer membrane protein assembly factor BamB family protein n=1 Tax=Streptomyces sp. NPDC013953 TaxID=3364868 RepID=UPI0036F73BC8